MNKRELKKWLENEKYKALKAENERFKSAQEQLKETLIKASGLNLVAEKFVQSCGDWVKAYEKWEYEHRESLHICDYYSNSISGVINSITPLTPEKFIEHYWDRSVNFSNIPEHKALYKENQDNRSSIEKTYNNLGYNIEACKTAKEAIAYLETLGIKVPDENEKKPCTSVMVPIDTKFLYIPKKEEQPDETN